MLKMRYLIENFDLAREALSHFDHDAEGLDECLRHFRISANAIYPYTSAGALHFLRLAPTQEKDEADMRGEIEFLRALEAQGYPAMRPVCAKDGSYLLRLNTHWGEYLACVFTGVPGRPIEDMEPDPVLMRAYGGALARLHAVSEQTAPVRRPDHTAVLRWVRGQLREFHAPEAALQACGRLEHELARIPRAEAEYGLVHYDFEPDNVFFEPETGLCHAIDFDDSIYCWYALDIEQALDCIESGFHADFLAGYASVRPLLAGLDALRPLMRRLIDLRSYARLIRCLSDRPEPAPEWMPALRERLQARADWLGAKICASIDETASHSV